MRVPNKWMRRLALLAVIVLLASTGVTLHESLTNDTTTVTVTDETPDYVSGEIVFYDEASDEQQGLFDNAINNGHTTTEEDATELQGYTVLVKDGQAYTIRVERRDSPLEAAAYIGVIVSAASLIPVAVFGSIKGFKVARRRIRLR